MSRPPMHASRNTRSVGLVVLSAVCALVAMMVIWLVFFRIPDLQQTVQSVTTAGAQNQAKMQANNLATVGPPIASISAGKEKPEPTKNAPLSPAPTYTQAVPVPPTQAQVDAGVEAYFAENPPDLQVSDAALTTKVATFVAEYLREHPAPSGKNGANGKAGKDGKPGATGSPGAACTVEQNPDCQGPAGKDGATGATGPQGPGPTDSQIAAAVQTYLPGAVAAYLQENPPPSGPPGKDGTNGTDGKNGTDGTNGTNGTDGKAGAPPAAWSWTDPTTQVTYVCTQDPGSSNDAPTYTCTGQLPDAPSSDTPTPTPDPTTTEATP